MAPPVQAGGVVFLVLTGRMAFGDGSVSGIDTSVGDLFAEAFP
jgi:hypothetical protein